MQKFLLMAENKTYEEEGFELWSFQNMFLTFKNSIIYLLHCIKLDFYAYSYSKQFGS